MPTYSWGSFMACTALKDSTLILGTGECIEQGTIILRDDKIESVGQSLEVSVPEDAQVFDCSGKYILPGLIDAHIHLDMHGMSDTYHESLVEDKLRTIRAAIQMSNTVRCGITTVRNAGSVNYIDVAVKKAVNLGYLTGPRILASGKIICMHSAGNEYFEGLYREADGTDENRRAAREQLKAGADLLKVMATGAIMNPGGVPGAPHLDIEEIRAVVQEGEKSEKYTAAHAHGPQGIKNAIKAGVRTIEHGTLADEDALKMMADQGIFLTSTLSSNFWMIHSTHSNGIPQFMFDKAKNIEIIRKQNLKRAIDRGVRIVMGTDAGTPYNYHGKNAFELVQYVQDDLMTEMEAIRSATQIAAEALGLKDVLGTLEEGKYADLIVLETNPLQDINCLLQPDNFAYIFKEGKRIEGRVNISQWNPEPPLGMDY